jgi:hypothetical protein
LQGEASRAFFSAIEQFKSFLLEADAEALKGSGEVSEATGETAERNFLDLCHAVHTAIGGSSAENSTIKAELGARLLREILPFILLTQTPERLYSKPRGNAGDFLTIEMIYRNQPAGTGRIGPLLDRGFLNSPAAEAIGIGAICWPEKLWGQCRQRMVRFMLPARLRYRSGSV